MNSNELADLIKDTTHSSTTAEEIRTAGAKFTNKIPASKSNWSRKPKKIEQRHGLREVCYSVGCRSFHGCIYKTKEARDKVICLCEERLK
jgi:hypothetical protein